MKLSVPAAPSIFEANSLSIHRGGRQQVRRWSWLIPAITLAASMLMASPAQAITQSWVACDSGPLSMNSCSASFSYIPGEVYWNTSAYAAATHGSLHASAYADGAATSPADSHAFAEFSDTMTIGRPGEGNPSSKAYVTFSNVLAYRAIGGIGLFSGVGDRSVIGIGLALTAITPYGQFESFGSQNTSVSSNVDGWDYHFIDELERFNFPINLGETFYIRVQLSADASIQGNATALVDAAHSFYWGGLESIVDEDGKTIENIHLTSASGTDWLQSFVPTATVPEPASLMLASVGLFAGWNAKRRSRH